MQFSIKHGKKPHRTTWYHFRKMPVSSTLTIVIIGGSFAGVVAVRELFNQPQPVKVILITSLIKAYNNAAAARLFVKPELTDQALVDLNQLKKRQRHHHFEIIEGMVTKVDTDSNTVIVGNDQKIPYDYLIVALGTRYQLTAFKPFGEISNVEESIKSISERITEAHDICVVGGGPTGLEVVGEIGLTYPDKKLTLVVGKRGPVPRFGANVIKTVHKKLQKYNVTVIKDHGIVNGNDVEYNGAVHHFDLVIPTCTHTPNTEFLSPEYVNERGYANVDRHFRVKGTDNVFAFGDVVQFTTKTAIDINGRQQQVFAATLQKEVFGKDVKLKEYHEGAISFAVPIGPDGGVGYAGGWRLPNFMVWMMKLRDFSLSQSQRILT